MVAVAVVAEVVVAAAGELLVVPAVVPLPLGAHPLPAVRRVQAALQPVEGWE